MEKHCRVKQATDVTIWRMRIACWIPKATNTLRVCNTYCFSIVILIARTLLDVTLYVNCLYWFKVYSQRFSAHFYTPIRALPSVCYPISTKFHRNPHVISRWNLGTDKMRLVLPTLQRTVKRKEFSDEFERHRPKSRPITTVNVWFFLSSWFRAP